MRTCACWAHWRMSHEGIGITPTCRLVRRFYSYHTRAWTLLGSNDEDRFLWIKVMKFLCVLTLLTNFVMQKDNASSYLWTYLRVNMFGNQASVENFKRCLKFRDLSYYSFALSHFLRVCLSGSNFRNCLLKMKSLETAVRNWWLLVFATTLSIFVVQLVRFPLFISRMFACFYVHDCLWHR